MEGAASGPEPGRPTSFYSQRAKVASRWSAREARPRSPLRGQLCVDPDNAAQFFKKEAAQTRRRAPPLGKRSGTYFKVWTSEQSYSVVVVAPEGERWAGKWVTLRELNETKPSRCFLSRSKEVVEK